MDVILIARTVLGCALVAVSVAILLHNYRVGVGYYEAKHLGILTRWRMVRIVQTLSFIAGTLLLFAK